ncbi:collagen like protein [Brevibacillus laterosporus]|nr:collagen like protein [Brevibacillus laterosporus]
MPFSNKVVNGDFETGTLFPWSFTNVSITNLQSHTGFFSALLFGDTANSLLFQAIPVTPGDSFELFLSIAKLGNLVSPQVNIALLYLDVATIPVGIGLNLTIPVGHLPDNTANIWTTIYETTSVVPATATQALLIINKIAALSTADIVVDDIGILQTSGGATGATGATGDTGPTGATGPTGSFSNFQVSENTPNTVGSSSIVLSSIPTTLKTITITGSSASNRIWLNGAIGWQNGPSNPVVQFQILRGTTVIYSTGDQRTGTNTLGTTSISHVDLTPGTGNVTYSLTAHIVGGGTATIIGGITFTGALL